MKRSMWWLAGAGVVVAACASDGDAPGGTPTAGSAGMAEGGAEAMPGGAGKASALGGAADGGSSSDAGKGGKSADGGGGGTDAGENGGALGELGFGGLQEFPGDPVIDPSCGDFVEQQDLSNDYGLWEQAGDFVGESRTICGRINATHYDPNDGEVDRDRYDIGAEPGDYLVTLELLEDGAIDQVLLRLYPSGTYANAQGFAIGKTAVAAAHVFADEDGDLLSVMVTATHSAPLASSIDYRLTVRKDNLATRCGAVTAGNANQTFAEANDGASHNGNDVLRPSYTVDPEAGTPGADAPEASGIQLASGHHSLITGVSGKVDYGEDYLDGDTYAFRTGNVDQLTVRTDWTGVGVDLDFLLYEEDQFKRLAVGVTDSTTGPDASTFRVKPNTNYWLWVAAADFSTVPASLPRDYNVTLCGETFQP